MEGIRRIVGVVAGLVAATFLVGCTGTREEAVGASVLGGGAGACGEAGQVLSGAGVGDGGGAKGFRGGWTVYGSRGELRAAVGLSIPVPDDPGGALRAVASRVGPLVRGTVSTELRLVRERVSRSGVVHWRYGQFVEGLPVYHRRLELHVREGRVTALNADLADVRRWRGGVLSLDRVLAVLDGEELHAVPGSEQAFVWVSEDGVAERVWALVVDGAGRSGRFSRGSDGPTRVLVSRVDGRILFQESLVRLDASWSACMSPGDLDCMVETSGVGDDGETYGLTLFRGAGFPPPTLVDGYLHPYDDADYPDLIGGAADDDIFFVDLSRSEETGAVFIIQSDGSVFSAYDRQFFDSGDHVTAGPGPTFDDTSAYGSSVSALWAVRAALDYYRDVHGRAGLDDTIPPMDVVARVDLSGYNAAWISDYDLLCIGTSRATSLAVAIDVIGHELTHAVIDFDADLEYTGQSGALSEAMADLFGTFVEAHATGELEWWIGEDVPGRRPVRNLAHPELFGMPGHMSGYVGEEDGYTPLHYDSAILNKAMYLAVAGTPSGKSYHGYQVSPIDPNPDRALDLLARCAYDTLTTRLTPTSGFTEFAVSMLGAALDLGLARDDTERLYSSLLQAFLATGILTDLEGNPRAILSGRVLSEQDGAPVAGASVVLEVGQGRYETTSDLAGNFQFEVNEATESQARVTASAVGFYDTTLLVPAPVSGTDTPGSVQVVTLDLATRPPPRMEWRVSPSPLVLSAGQSGTVRIELTNAGEPDSELTYRLRPTVDYTWSQIPFFWEDISDQGTLLNLTGDQGHTTALTLVRPFPFYFGTFNQLFVSTDGYVTLTEDSSDVYRESSLPSSGAPANLVAPFWADLDFGSARRAYFLEDPTLGLTWVQFQDVPDFAGQFHYTFQVVLSWDGRIRFYYQDIPGVPESWARVGIQDGEGIEGLEVAVITPAEDSSLPATRTGIELVPSILPAGGIVSFPGGTEGEEGILHGGVSVTFEIGVSAADLPPGDQAFLVRADTNDPIDPVEYFRIAVQVE